jgi:CRISPR/Cas system-associated exonuclease Cas4 (RecB family)
MTDKVPPGFTFSQANLNLFQACPRRFFLRYLRKMDWPSGLSAAEEERENALARGQRFHYLVQQDVLGLAAGHEVEASGDPVLVEWWSNFNSFKREPEADEPFTELELCSPFGDFMVVAKFDRLVAATDGEFVIYDWKTGFREPKLEQYKTSWQTALYPYVLVEGGEVINGGDAIAADRVCIVYWHAQYPQVVHRFPYSIEQHTATRDRMSRAIEQISARRGEEEFELTSEISRCRSCEFRSYCGRQGDSGPEDEEEGQEFVEELWEQEIPNESG